MTGPGVSSSPQRSSAGRRMTNPSQRSGYVWWSRRMERAFMSGDPGSDAFQDPWHMQSATLWGGMVGLAGVMALALFISFLRPAPDKGVDSIVIAQPGGMYVVYGDQLRPVDNLASARLIVGKPDNATIIKSSTLEDYPRGPAMGIPGAPQNLDAHDRDPATWTVCDRKDATSELNLTTGEGLRTTIIAGEDQLSPDAEDLGDSKAVLARSSTNPTLWLIFKGFKAEVGPNDFPTHAALGLTPAKVESAMTLSDKLLNAIEPLPALTVPFLNDRGRVSAAVDGKVIGDILTVTTDSGTDSYVVADRGVQKITPVVAALLVNTGSRQTPVQAAQDVTMLNHVQVIDTERFPATIPEIVAPPTVCYSWAKGRTEMHSKTRVIIGDSLPLTEESRKNLDELLPPREGVVQADARVMSPGKGWYVAVTGSSENSRTKEQLLFIEDTGVRHFIAPQGNSYDPVVGALGLNWQNPMPIPWAIAELFVQGSNLSIEAARMEHPYIPLNPNAIPVPPKPGELTMQDPGSTTG